jgi:hypothetical protein
MSLVAPDGLVALRVWMRRRRDLRLPARARGWLTTAGSLCHGAVESLVRARHVLAQTRWRCPR